MLRPALCLLLSLAFLAVAPVPADKAATSDPEVLKGIKLVDEGDYDAAIVTLDSAARRLAADRTKVKDLSQAYLYLGIAYVGKGHEAAAKAKFREAVSQIKDLSLSADRYPPKVIDLFEAAKDEATRGVSAPPASKPVARSAPEAKSGGGGGKKLLLIGGGLAVAGGGAALALGGGGGEDPGCDSFFRDATGLLNATQTSFAITTTPTQAGHWTAELTFNVTASTPSSSASVPGFTARPPTVFLFAVNNSNNQDVGSEQLVAANAKKIEWEGTAGTVYRIGIDLVSATSATYTLAVGGPCF